MNESRVQNNSHLLVDCADGWIEIDGDQLLVRSAANPRMPVQVRLSGRQRQRLIDSLKIAEAGGWSVWRQGDDGNAFLIASGLSRDEADEMVEEFELHKHKQIYWSSQRRPSNAIR